MISEVQFAGEKWPVVFNIRAMFNVSKLLKIELQQLLDQLNNQDFDTILALITAGIQSGLKKTKDDRQITMDMVEDALDQDLELLSEIMEIMNQSSFVQVAEENPLDRPAETKKNVKKAG